MTEAREPSSSIDVRRRHRARDPVMGVTLYERVTALLVALLLILGGLSAGLGVLWAANRTTKPAPLLPVELLAGQFADEFGGGEPDGVLEGDLSMPGPESDSPATAADSEMPAADVREVEATIAEVADRAGAAVELAEQLFQNAPEGLAAGRRGTNSLPRVGVGNGRIGGAPASLRWEILFEGGVSAADYARQLDFLQIELGVVVDRRLYRFTQLASPKPAVRVTEPRASESEVVFVWRDERRRQVDLGLLRRADAASLADDAVVLHFCPSDTARKLERLEREYAIAHGRTDLRVVAKTRFVVKRTAAGYDIEVTSQRGFARYEGEVKP